MQISQILDNINLIMHRKNLLQKISIPMYENSDIFAGNCKYTFRNNKGDWVYDVEMYDLDQLIATVTVKYIDKDTTTAIDWHQNNKKYNREEIINKATAYARLQCDPL